MLVGHSMLWTQTPAPAESSAPSIPSTESARERDPGDDLFHGPEAQPKSVTARVPPETTLCGHHSRWNGYLQ